MEHTIDSDTENKNARNSSFLRKAFEEIRAKRGSKDTEVPPDNDLSRDIVSYNKRGTRVPIYLFPSVTLGATDFNGLAKFFDVDQPWNILNPPIDEFKAGPEGLVEEIAAHFANLLNKIQPEGPVVLGGWSAGVTLALALARQLQARDREVKLLIAIDQAPENTGVPQGGISRFTFRSRQIRSRIYDNRQGGKNWPDTIIDLGKKIFRDGAKEIAGRKQDEFENIIEDHPGFTQNYKNRIRRFYDAVMACAKPEPYQGRVLLLSASRQPDHKIREKWKSFAGDVEIEEIKATHLSIVRGDAEKLAKSINKHMDGFLSSPPVQAPARLVTAINGLKIRALLWRPS